MNLTLNIKNQILLDDLRNDFIIEFIEKNINYCEVFSINNTSTIYYNPLFVNDESIAHELLHIKLKRYNYVIGNHIYISCFGNKKLKKVLLKFLCDHIGNCCDHYKMYPQYLEMGYSPEKFLSSGLSELCLFDNLKKLKLKRFGIYNPLSVNQFIGSLISIYADHLQHDYSNHLNFLMKLDSELFFIVTTFWKNWELFDIENIDPIYNSDLQLSSNFVKDIEKWIKYKIVL